MNITLTTHKFLPHTGGIEIYNYKLAKKLGQKGHKVCLFTVLPKKSCFITSKYFSIHTFPQHFEIFRNPLSFNTFTLWKYLNKSDIINSHLIESFMTLSVFKAILKKKIPWVLTVHGLIDYGYDTTLFSSVHNIYSYINRKIIERANGIIVLTNHDKERLKDKYSPSCPVFTVPNAISINIPDSKQSFHSNIQKNQINRWSKEAKLIIGFVGSLTRVKNPLLFLKILKDLIEENLDIRGVIIGDGPLRKKVEFFIQKNMLKDRIICVYSVPPSEMPYFYKYLDILVLTSLSEGMPTSILQAWRASVPVIATNIPPLRCLVTPKTGFLCELKKSEFLRNIRKLINNPQKRKILGKNGRELVKRKYNWSNVSEKLEIIYQYIAEKYH